jgi:beta-lactamase class A
MRSALALVVLFLAACRSTDGDTAPATWRDEPLQQALQQRVQGFRGQAGIFVQHLGTGASAAILADTTFPTASMIKVPILATLLAAVARGELDWRQELVYDRKRLYPGDDIVGSFADGSRITLDRLAMLSITTSDNTAALWCQELCGTGTAINELLQRHGCAQTRVNSRTPGREADREAFGWGQTTPREMAMLLVKARRGELVDAAVSEELLRCTARIHFDGEALAMIPPGVMAFSKQGAVNRSRSEVVLVCAPHGDYVFCAITREQEDQGWTRDNEGWRLLRDVSALLWRHFEPDLPYTPPAGAERFW